MGRFLSAMIAIAVVGFVVWVVIRTPEGATDDVAKLLNNPSLSSKLLDSPGRNGAPTEDAPQPEPTLSAAELNSEDQTGVTPLIRAAGIGDLTTAQKQINGGADTNLKTTKDKLTALKVASYCGRLEMVKLLIAKGAIVGQDDVEYAANGGHKDIVAYYKAAAGIKPKRLSALDAFLSVGSMPLKKLDSLCGGTHGTE